MTLNVGSDGMGSWCFGPMEPFLRRTFPHTTITFDQEKPFDLVFRSHFTKMEAIAPYTCPYILWSGESRGVAPLADHDPLFELNTFHSKRPNSIHFPHLITELRETKRPAPVPKIYCCAYAFSNCVVEREQLFRAMRWVEPTCYSFGRSCPTYDRPFVAPAKIRRYNASLFNDFAFNVAMENMIAPGYMTEKIGFAFCSGSVPIYWGCTKTVNEFFNPAAFVNVCDYASPKVAGEMAIQIWRDRQKFQQYLDAPITVNTKLADYEAIYTEYRPWQKPMVDILQDTFPDFS